MRIAHVMAASRMGAVVDALFSTLTRIPPLPPPPFPLEDYAIIIQARYQFDLGIGTRICFSSGGVLTEDVFKTGGQLFANTICLPDAESDSYFNEYEAESSGEDPAMFFCA
jgi:hypothetical protein